MNDTPQLLALMQKTRDMRAYDCVKEFESLARKLESENAALRKALDQQMKYERNLRADRDRLDWLAVSNVWIDYPATESYTPETFRTEIDRKMKEAQP